MERRMRVHLLQVRQKVQVYFVTYRLQRKLYQEQDTFFCRVTSVAGHSNQNLSPVPQAPVVQTLDSAIHRINHYPVDKIEMYPMDSAIHAIF